MEDLIKEGSKPMEAQKIGNTYQLLAWAKPFGSQKWNKEFIKEKLNLLKKKTLRGKKQTREVFLGNRNAKD